MSKELKCAANAGFQLAIKLQFGNTSANPEMGIGVRPTVARNRCERCNGLCEVHSNADGSVEVIPPKECPVYNQ